MTKRTLSNYAVYVFTLLLMPLISYADFSHIQKKVELRVCNSSYMNAVASVKKVYNGNKERIGKDVIGDYYGCFNFTEDNVICDEIILYGNSTEISGKELGRWKCVPEKPTIDLTKVHNEAENKARYVANRIAEKYADGKANFAYNYIQGIKRAEEQIPGSSEARESEKIGFDSAQTPGQTAGASNGKYEGTYSGSRRAENDVESHYLKFLDSSSFSEAIPSKKVPSFYGNALDGDKKTNAESLINESVNQDTQVLYNLSSEYKNLVLNRSLDRDNYIGDYSASSELNKFINNDPLSDFYRQLNDYSNEVLAKSEYEYTFKKVFSEVIEEKIWKKIVANNSLAMNSGFEATRKALLLAAQNKGYNEGFSEASKEASKNAFPQAFTTAYENQFKERVNFFNTHVILHSINAEFFTPQENKNFIVGQPIDLKIHNIVNIGRQSGTVKIKLSDSSKEFSVDLKGLSNSGPRVIKEVTMLSAKNKLGSAFMRVCFDNFCVNENLEIKWVNQLNGLGALPSESDSAHILTSFIEGVLIGEWKTLLAQAPTQGQSVYDKYPKTQDNKNSSTPQATYDVKEFAKTYLGQLESFAAQIPNKILPVSSSAQTNGGPSLKSSKNEFYKNVIRICEDYLRLKNAMLSKEAAASGLTEGFYPGFYDDAGKPVYFSKMTDEQKSKSIDNISKTQEQYYSWVTNDSVRTEQMKNCVYSKESHESCISLLSLSDTKKDIYRLWNLGNKHIKRVNDTAKKELAPNHD